MNLFWGPHWRKNLTSLSLCTSLCTYVYLCLSLSLSISLFIYVYLCLSLFHSHQNKVICLVRIDRKPQYRSTQMHVASWRMTVTRYRDAGRTKSH